ncbi:MAG TPA: LarC family nickel insertion protein, partial [Papillibacter sp.]|nr:LarC family nickel insertion protein [Papillibacter sp.]
AAGALDVFTTPISMKKNRPAVMLTCLCRPEQREVFSRLIFRHTSTIGVRYATLRRDVLERTTLAVETPYGAIRIKISRSEEGRKIKPEYDDVAAAALREGVPFSEVHAAALRAAQSSI